jgi:hypothetical protein
VKKMAERKGLRKAIPFNEIDYLTRPKCRFEPKRQFPGLSNRDGPPDPENRTAAPTGIGSGGNIGKLIGNSKSEDYSTEPLAARFPIIAMHFGFDELEVAA